MMAMFKAKVRKVGTSMGVILPKEIVKEQNIKEGKEIEFFLPQKNSKLIERYFGSAKGAKPFKRDRTIDKYREF